MLFNERENMNKKMVLIGAVVFGGVLPAAMAASFEEQARVISVTPQMEMVNQPRQECTTEYVQEKQERGLAGSLIGGVAGGILGNQVGGGNGRTVATAVGAVTGALVGDRVQNSDAQTTQRPVQRCRMVNDMQQRTNGYAVTYEYQGRTYTSVMPYAPGKTIRVNVAVTPM
jgi:uncharacterized protein YcfJ